jgi:SAM-dependent methyltransferase
VRTPGVTTTNAPVLLGDVALAQVLAGSMLHEGAVDRVTHGFHTWPAGLHPDTARDLVGALPGRSVLDPFCGGGTVLVEALLAGKRAVGRDLSRIALRVARGRATPWDEALLTRARSIGRQATADARKATEPPPPRILAAARDWYLPHVLAELEVIRRAVSAADPDVRPILEVVFSSILIKVSHRVSDTSPRREVKDRPVGTTAVWFHKKLREYGRRAAALRAAIPEGTPPVDLGPSDARHLRLRKPVDLVITSPPYPSTYDYLPLQHLRNVWLGEEPDEDREIGARRAFRDGEGKARKQWVADTHEWTRRAAEALAPGGHLVVVIGDGLVPTGAIDTSEPTEDAARAAGLQPVARASVERVDHARGTSRWEHAFAFRR